MKPVALQLYTLREFTAKDMGDVLNKVANYGYVGVEFAGFGNLSVEEISKVLNDLGLIAVSAHVSLPTKENIEQIAKDAETIGYKRIISGFGPNDMKDVDGLKRCIDRFALAVELAESVGLSFGMHNHWWEFDREFEGKKPYDMILESVPKLFSELDIYWSSHAGVDTVEVIKKWADRVPLLHVKDGDLTDPPVHKPVGSGKVKTRDIILSANSDVLEWLIVELDTSDMDMFQAVKMSIDWLVENGLGKRKD